MNLKRLMDTPPWEWPEDAGKEFHRVLADDQADADDRIIAAELAGDITVINDELVNALLSVLKNPDESEDLRCRSAISLGPALNHADTEGFDDPDTGAISEKTFRKIQESFRRLYLDASVPKIVRRRILEASVRAPHNWHKSAIRAAYAGDDEDWKLTAVFSMRWVRGFDDQILESLESNNPHIHYEAVCAAGSWELDKAWPHVSRLVSSSETEKFLLLAAIEAAANIRPDEAGAILVDLTDSDDEDIREAASEAMLTAEGPFGDDFEEEDDDDDDWYVR
jgi:uncharacterized protein (UPF0147 family)